MSSAEPGKNKEWREIRIILILVSNVQAGLIIFLELQRTW